MRDTIKKGLIMALAIVFVLVGLQTFAQAYSDNAMKKVDEIKDLKAQKKEMPKELAGVKQITTDELKKWLDEGKTFVILDNRDSKEYEAEHIPGAKRVGVDELLKNGPKEAEAAGVKKDDIIVNYCNGIMCWRSPAAAVLLLDAGYKNIYWYRDGIPEWVRKGYNTVEGKEAGSWKK